MPRAINAAVVVLLSVLMLPAADDPPNPELERTRALIEAGALPRDALESAEAEIERARLTATLRELLKKRELTLGDLTPLLDAARRLRDLGRSEFARQANLVKAGAAPAKSLAPARDRLELAEKQVQLAEARAGLVRELAAMAQAESRLDELEEDELAFWSEGEPGQWDSDIAEIDALYSEEFGGHLPISAAGDTDLHRSMGFDHTGRYDVALHPDDLEGLFLTTLLESWGIPFIAFRSAVPDQATGPHIHIGLPSLRVDPAFEGALEATVETVVE